MFDEWKARANADAGLVRRGRLCSTTFLLERDDEQHLVRIVEGKVDTITAGPLVMPRWQFALRTSREAWETYCRPLPPPGYHDLLAMVRYKRLKVEGDQHPFMANLLYFKDLLSRMRSEA